MPPALRRLCKVRQETRNVLAKQTWRAAASVRKRLTCSTSHRLQGVTSATLCACLRKAGRRSGWSHTTGERCTAVHGRSRLCPLAIEDKLSLLKFKLGDGQGLKSESLSQRAAETKVRTGQAGADLAPAGLEACCACCRRRWLRDRRTILRGCQRA